MGELVDGKFRVEDVLGCGGAGVVVAARHDVLEQRVAIKMLHASPHHRPRAFARLLSEARAASALRSIHVPRVYDVGTLESGAPFIVMELLFGEDLAQRLSRSGALPVGEAVACILQACDAIGEAHAHGIVHRDLKPANLFLARDRSGASVTKVLDFGISKIHGETSVQLTTTGALMGTPRYMSPEQLIDPAATDARTDIWSLGVILYELVIGRPPFDASSFALLTQSILNDEAPTLAARCSITRALSPVVARCLEKDRERRFSSTEELVRALELALRGVRTSARGRRIAIAGAAVALGATVLGLPELSSTGGPVVEQPAHAAPRMADVIVPASAVVEEQGSSPSAVVRSVRRASMRAKPEVRVDHGLELDNRF